MCQRAFLTKVAILSDSLFLTLLLFLNDIKGSLTYNYRCFHTTAPASEVTGELTVPFLNRQTMRCPFLNDKVCPSASFRPELDVNCHNYRVRKRESESVATLDFEKSFKSPNPRERAANMYKNFTRP
jgi:hypothetical protein